VAGTELSGIFRSTDNGFTWMQESPAASSGLRDGNIYGMTFDRNGNVFFGSQGGIWKSSKTSTGYSWTNVLKNTNTSVGKGLGADANGYLYYGHNHTRWIVRRSIARLTMETPGVRTIRAFPPSSKGTNSLSIPRIASCMPSSKMDQPITAGCTAP